MITICKKNPEHQKWFEQIIGQQMFSDIHSAGPEYTGPAFNRCPWCLPSDEHPRCKYALDCVTPEQQLRCAGCSSYEAHVPKD